MLHVRLARRARSNLAGTLQERVWMMVKNHMLVPNVGSNKHKSSSGVVGRGRGATLERLGAARGQQHGVHSSRRGEGGG